MEVSVLFSGGKDSSLAAVLLSALPYFSKKSREGSTFFEVELVTCSFGILSNWKQAEKVAKKLGFPFRVLKLKKEILNEAARQVIKDGFPNNGIKYIHQKALEEVAKKSEIIADGIRRDDRVPVLSLAEIRRLEDKFDVHYIQPLMGYSRKTIDLLVKQFFIVKEYKSTSFFKGAEYEFELREIIRKGYGIRKIKEIFPKNHSHSIVKEVKSRG